MARVLDNWISESAKTLEVLPREAFALFFAYIAERLLPLYRAFEKKHRWGDSSVLECQLDSVWGVLAGVPATVTRDGLRMLADITPSGEHFDSPDSTYAQDAIVCVDAALRALLPGEALDGNWVEYALEPIRTKVSFEMCGYMSVEGKGAEEWEERLWEDPEIIEFVRDCERIIAQISSTSSISSLTAAIRSEARSKQLRAQSFVN